MKTDLAITGVGMVSPVGNSALVCLHSVRSAVTRLSVQKIPDRARDWVVGGRVFRWTPYVGSRHLRALAEAALRQALTHARLASGVVDGPLAVMLCAPEEFRPGFRFPMTAFDPARWLEKQNLRPVAHFEVLSAGASSAHLALHRAAQLIESGAASVCVIGVADSQLQLRTTRWHEDNYRLKCSYLTDGLIPGEASCFLVVEAPQHARSRGASVIARVLSVAGGREVASVLSDRPNTAGVLTNAVRTALEEADVVSTDVGMIWCDLNGESYRAREWAFAEIRLAFQTHTELIHPADCHGDLGAATDANLLGLAALCHGTGWSDGKPLLVFSGSEGGLRAAAVLGPPDHGLPFLQVSRDVPRVLSDGFGLPAPPDPSEDFRDSDDPPRAYFEWQLREEHRDEIASLYYQRTAILHDQSIPWPRLREPEQRMLNHLDAAVASGPQSMAAVSAGIQSDEEGLCFAGAFLISTLPTARNLALIASALDPPVPARLNGIGSALVHAPESAALREFLQQALQSPNPAIQAMATFVAGRRRLDIRPQLGAMRTATDSELLRAIAETSRRLMAEEATPALQRMLSHERPDVRKAALFALLRLAPAPTAALARERLRANPEFDGALTTCVGIAGQLRDARLLIEYFESRPSDVAALDAVGVLGAPESIPYLIGLLSSDEDPIRVASASALKLISGVSPRERVVVEAEDDAASGEPREIERVATSAAIWSEWWGSVRSRVDLSRRLRRGQYFSIGECINELADPMASYEARMRAFIEVTTRASVQIPYEPDWFVSRQDQALHALRAWWDDQQH